MSDLSALSVASVYEGNLFLCGFARGDVGGRHLRCSILVFSMLVCSVLFEGCLPLLHVSLCAWNLVRVVGMDMNGITLGLDETDVIIGSVLFIV